MWCNRVAITKFESFFLMAVLGWQITQTIPNKFKWSQIISLFSEESSKQHIYFPSECKGLSLVSTKTELWREKEKNYFESNVSSKVLLIRLNFEKPFKFTIFKMYKVKFTWLWKRTWNFTKILLEKGCDLSKSLEPNTVLSYKCHSASRALDVQKTRRITTEPQLS